MTDEERDLIQRFVARVGGAAPAGGGFGQGGSVPATTVPALPPVDREADGFIADQFSRYPEARYRVTQMAFVQEAALSEAQNRIRRLEWELTQARQAQTSPQSQGQAGGHTGGFFGNLFGGGRQQAPQAAPGAPNGQPGYQNPSYQNPGYQGGPPPAQYPPGYQPGMFSRGGGSGFLGSALTTAAGVAGGVLAADALTSMFHGGGMGGMGGGFGGGGEVINETVNNYGDAAPAAGGDPWSGGGQDYQGAPPDAAGGDPFSGGGGDFAGGDPGAVDPGGFDGGGGGWDDSNV